MLYQSRKANDHTGQCFRRIAGGNIGLPLDTM